LEEPINFLKNARYIILYENEDRSRTWGSRKDVSPPLKLKAEHSETRVHTSRSIKRGFQRRYRTSVIFVPPAKWTLRQSLLRLIEKIKKDHHEKTSLLFVVYLLALDLSLHVARKVVIVLVRHTIPNCSFVIYQSVKSWKSFWKL